MRGHIIGLPKLLTWFGMAVMAVPVVFMAWGFTSSPQPGEAIPDSIAATLHGGQCYAKKQFKCADGMGDCMIAKVTCKMQSGINYQFEDVATQNKATCKMQSGINYQFEDVATQNNDAPAGDALCCGNAGISCTDVWNGSKSCSSGSGSGQ